MILSPLTFIKQTSNSIKVRNNMFNLGYKCLTFYPSQCPERKIERVFTNSVEMEITGLDAGTYIFTLSSSTNDESYTTSFFINGENNTAIIKRLIDYIKDPVDEDVVQKNIELNRSKLYAFDSITESFAAKYNNLSEPSDTEEKAFYQILYACERMENLVMIKQNTMISDVTIDYGATLSINAGANVTSLDIFKAFGPNKFLKKISVNSFEDIELYLPENELYYIDLCHDAEILGRLVYYRFSDTIAKWLYENQSDLDSSIDRTIIDDAMLKYDTIDFSDDEKEQLIDEKNAFIKEWIVRPPIIIGHTANEESILRIQIPDYDMIKLLDKKIYLSASDSDVFMNLTCYPWIEITDEIVEFNLSTPNISDDIIFFIQDENGTIISNYTRYNQESDDYEIKKKTLDNLEYSESLQKWLSSTIEDESLLNKIRTEIKNLAQDTSLTFLDIFHNTLTKVTQNNTFSKLRNNIIIAVLNHWFNGFDIFRNFFDNSIVPYYPSTRRIELQDRDPNYLINIMSWNIDDEEINIDYRLGSIKEATSVNIGVKDFYIIHMVDLDNYKKSGYVYISNQTGDSCITSNRFKIEVNKDSY